MSKTNYTRIKTGNHNRRRNLLMNNFPSLPLTGNKSISNSKEKKKERWSSIGNRFDNSLSARGKKEKNKNINLWDYGNNNYVDRGLLNKILSCLEKKKK